MSRLARIGRSVIALVTGHALQIITQLVLAPLFLAKWGATTYGTWLTISAAVSYVAYADIGITAYSVPRLMRSYGQEDWSDFDEYLHSATAAILTLTALVALVGASVAAMLLASGVEPRLVGTGVLLGAQALLLLAQSFVSLPYSIVARADRAYANASAYAAALLGCSLVVLICGGDPVVMAATQVLVTLARVALTWLDGRMLAPRARPGLRAARRQVALALLPRSMERALANVGPLLTVQGLLLAVSAALGSTAAALFSTHRTLVNFARLPSGLMINSLYLEFADMLVRGDRAQGARLLRIATAVAVSVTFPALAILATLGPDLYRVWMRGRLPATAGLLALLCAEVLVLQPIQVIRTVVLANNEHRLSVWTECGTALLALGASMIGARFIGVLAMPVSLLLFQAPVFGLVVVREVARVLGESWSPRTFVVLLGKGLVLTALCVAACSVARLATEAVIARVVLAVLACGSLGAVALWSSMLGSEERVLLEQRLQRVFPHARVPRLWRQR